MSKVLIVCFLFVMACTPSPKNHHTTIYTFDENAETRWSSPENLNGGKGTGGKENNGAKGHPTDNIDAGTTRTLLDIKGQGVINRIWFTINDRSLEMLRSLKIEMYWDNEQKPAVSVPVADFYGMGQGTAKFENEFFSSPEGRSFNCYIPMPFKSAAKITITNESKKKLNTIFFDVDYTLLKNWDDNFMYFHAFWNRDTATKLSEDFDLLPAIKGKGRIIGTHVSVNANPLYKKSWWGEGEVKMYVDGDTDYPTLIGTGTEDYIGTAWGQGAFTNRYTGCLAANDSADRWSFYRYHVPDPVYFSSGIKITLQQIGGIGPVVVLDLMDKNVPLIPIALDDMEKSGKFIHIYQKGKVANLREGNLPNNWTNFYRSDDVAASTFFYLNKPSNELPAIKPVDYRIAKLK